MGILYFIRHGETNYNHDGIYVGWKNVKLNDKGIKQAHTLGKKLNKENIDLIITSPLVRAKETAYIVKKYIEKPVIIDNRFIEVNIGAYEGLTEKEISDIIQKRYKNDFCKFYNNTPRGGESVSKVNKRVYRGLNDIKNNYPDKKILLVTHGLIIRVINKYFNPHISFQDFFNFLIKNAEVKKAYF